jgi:hypothetical protein
MDLINSTPSETDVHICVVREGEPLYVPETVSSALGLDNGGSYAVIRIAGLAVITPCHRVPATGCEQFDNVVLASDVPSLLAQIDAARAGLVSRAA